MTLRRTVTILGATGSVGGSTLDLIERNAADYQVLALTAHRDVEGLAAASRRVGAERAVIADESLLPALQAALEGSDVAASAGEGAILDAAAAGADWTMAAIVGCAGLKPTMAALRGGRTVALANKESLVSAGALMTDAAAASGAKLLPVDSEHNAIFQCFDAARPESVRRIILTASGGPFRTRSLDEMRAMTPAQAVAHPNWSMGAKISVDSATLMNKGLELIEAFHLFPLDADGFDVVIHPQSVIHSLVEYVDGSVLAQLGAPDMRIPIAYALAWPRRMETPCERLDLVRTGNLAFEAPDLERFPALGLAMAALREGGAAPAILNAANEIAVAAFLEGSIGFLDIASISAETLRCCTPPPPASIEEVLEIDREARAVATGVKRRYLR
ncbi:1-deoxy-D-xylulose-5-phosphate reductoisomerase [Sphingosinicella sp. BN140058]|uniref:1-deoxy-D-xylulose-5-phosphate reductoisomerase n=1 Tax=Sphingosinicella sp. BN140058 TaxID=1892855 RepID=UPI001011C539|nr:1-deoxy-D-xylulose-5-phosphate reductoisomerase [Sphingosinicella sp. BN140058]QAY79390.1 1-deoxy-D-xylulose-5-phosphate reductoisomerase [Sphingosinicella sp. BN140058]